MAKSFDRFQKRDNFLENNLLSSERASRESKVGIGAMVSLAVPVEISWPSCEARPLGQLVTPKSFLKSRRECGSDSEDAA